MKIFYLANARIPTEKAHGFQIMKMSESLAGQGAVLTLVTPTRRNKKFFQQNPFVFYGIKPNFSWQKIFTFDPIWLAKLPGGIYLKIQSLFFVLGLIFYFWRYLPFGTDKQPVIYTRDEYLLPFLTLWPAKVVWEGHALPRKKNFYSHYFKRCHRLIVLTQQMKNDLLALGLAAEKILVAPDAVDLTVFDLTLERESAQAAVGLPSDKIILGYTGNFKTKGMDKGLADIFSALQISCRKDWLFVAVGGSQQDIQEYQDLARRLGVDDQVRLLAKVPQSQLAVYQRAFDFLLMPFPFKTHYAYYMSPLKMFEYMAAQRPIIASDLPTIREILTPETAFFCRPGDPADLARVISEALKNKPLADKLSKQAHEAVFAFTWQKRAAKIIEFIDL